MSVTLDESAVLLTGGVAIVAFARQADDWSSWSVLFNNSVDQPGLFAAAAKLSGDGETMVLGAQDGLRVYSFNASASRYQPIWHQPPPEELSVGVLALNTIGAPSVPLLIAVGYNGPNSNRFVVQAYNGADGTRLWQYDSFVSTGQYTDTAASIAVTENGEAVVLGTWGDAELLNPQLHVFRGWDGAGSVWYNYTTTGSVTAVSAAMSLSEPSTVLIGVSSMKTHENVGLAGGVALAFAVQL